MPSNPVWFTAINKPSHLAANSSLFIELMFTLQPNLVMKSDFHSSPHLNSHYQIVFAKFNLKFCYPSPYEHEIYNKRRVLALFTGQSVRSLGTTDFLIQM